MTTGKITLNLHGGVATSRDGKPVSPGISTDEQAAINKAAKGMFDIEQTTTYELASARSTQESLEIKLAGGDVVLVELADGGQLWLSAESLQKLVDQQGAEIDLGSDTSIARGADATRGITSWIKRLVIPKINWRKGLEDKTSDLLLTKAIGELESALVDDRSGVYWLQVDENSEPDYKEVDTLEATDKPWLVFLHGTASSTTGSFQSLWGGMNVDGTQPRDKRRRSSWLMFAAKYEKRILALEHKTLSESPIDNVCTLLEALPANQRLHVVSHSRGGLVGELLCRANTIDASTGQVRSDPVTPDDIERYMSAYDEKDKAQNVIKAALERYNKLLKQKRPIVERFVRVACPSRGTTLASRRLDVYLNLILNAFQRAGTAFLGPIAGSFVGSLQGVIIGVARSRFDYEKLPGLRAQIPDGGLIRFINDPALTVDADLSVIAGNAGVTRNIKQTLLTAMSNLFYLQANDWVVETEAMIGGHPRPDSQPGQVLFDASRQTGSGVSHFNYFRNEKTFSALVRALETPIGHSYPIVDFESLADEEIKTTSRDATRDKKPPTRITVLLPGLPGTHLSAISPDGSKYHRIWLNLMRIAGGELNKLDVSKPEVVTDGLMRNPYGSLVHYLEKHQHNVREFPYDWRLSLKDNADLLMQELTKILDEHRGMPIRLLTHSMGGWVSLLCIRLYPALWERLCNEHDGRLLMAGTPLKGSINTARLLTAKHQLLRLVARVDSKHDPIELANQFRKYPGLLAALPKPDPNLSDFDFFSTDDWLRLKPAMDHEYKNYKAWRHPTQAALLDAFATQQSANVDVAPPNSARIVYIAGQGHRRKKTPAAIHVENEKFEFLISDAGDGLTMWDSVPTWLDPWYLPGVEHGNLFDRRRFFPAIQDLIDTGETTLVEQKRPAIEKRGAVPDKDFKEDLPIVYPNQADFEAAVLNGTASVGKGVVEESPQCQVSIRHCDLAYADAPIMVGHYQDNGIVGTERAVDNLMGGRLAALYEADLYPGPLNTVEIIPSQDKANGHGVVVTGLGRIGELSKRSLTKTLRNALVRFGLKVSDGGFGEASSKDTPVTLATLILGGQDARMQLIDCVAALLEALKTANIQLQKLDARPIHKLEIIELVEHQAVAIAHACYQLNDQYKSSIDIDPTVLQSPKTGGISFAYQSDYGSGWWQRIEIASADNGDLKFAVLTDRAGIPLETTQTQAELVNAMLAGASGQNRRETELNSSLFQLLIPAELKSQFDSLGDMVLMLDETTARYPWEMLTDRMDKEGDPMATRNGIVRQLKKKDETGRLRRQTTRNQRVLVVGDTLAGDGFAELPGAQREAKAVVDLFNSKHSDGANYTPDLPLIRATGLRIMTQLLNNDYQIIHLAAHGVYNHPMVDPVTRKPMIDPITEEEIIKSGMVLGDGMVLGASEIAALPIVPELVFINCCHLGQIDDPRMRKATSSNRNDLAANLGIAFIEAGAKCVIAAGWQVDDGAAEKFATIFYAEMLKGTPFGEAIRRARKTLFDDFPDSNTWGAYQCYGDQSYRLVKADAAGNSLEMGAKSLYSVREAIVMADNVRHRAFTANFPGADNIHKQLSGDLDRLEKEVEIKPFLQAGAVYYAVGAAYYELNEFGKAIDWCTKARGCEDSGGQLKLINILANSKARWAEQQVRTALTNNKPVDPACLEDAKEAIKVTTLATLLSDSRGAKYIRASTHKHYAMVIATLQKSNVKLAGLKNEDAPEHFERAGQYYAQLAEEDLHESGAPKAYPVLNAQVCQLCVHALSAGNPKTGHPNAENMIKELDAVLAQIERKPRVKRDFWEETDILNARLLKNLVVGATMLTADWQSLRDAFLQEFQATSRRQTDSVIKQIRLLNLVLNAEPETKTTTGKAITKGKTKAKAKAKFEIPFPGLRELYESLSNV